MTTPAAPLTFLECVDRSIQRCRELTLDPTPTAQLSQAQTFGHSTADTLRAHGIHGNQVARAVAGAGVILMRSVALDAELDRETFLASQHGPVELELNPIQYALAAFVNVLGFAAAALDDPA